VPPARALISFIFFIISWGVGSATCVATIQVFPGSTIVPERSPQNMSSTGTVTVAAVPRVPGVRSSLPLRHPRSRRHLLVGLGRGAEGLRCPCSADAGSSTQGECLLRTARWNHPAGVSRLLNPSIGGPPEADPSRVGRSLQSGTPTFLFRAWHSGAPQAKIPASVHRHKLPVGFRVKSTPVLGGLHHEYSLEQEAA